MKFNGLKDYLESVFLRILERINRGLKRFSFFCNSLVILDLCLNKERIARIDKKQKISKGSLKIIENNGRKIEEMTDANDTKPEIRKIKSHNITTHVTSQINFSIKTENAIKTPKLVATPLPPLKPKKIVQLWPHTTLMAARQRKRLIEIGIPSQTKISFAKSTAAVPLKMSKKRTVVPIVFPRTRKAFVAPRFPEPCWRRSIPRMIFPKRYAVGIEPSR